MKIKTDPVTNSSTCNFIVLGFKIPIKRKSNEDFSLKSKRKVLGKFYCNIKADDLPSREVEKLFEELFSNQFPVMKVNEEFEAPDLKAVLIGPELFSWSSNLKSMSLESLLEKVVDIKTEYNFKEEPKLFFGTRMT